MIRRLLIAGAALLIGGAGVHAAKEHVAVRFDVGAVVGTDGSLEVVETIAFRFTGGEFTKVTRELRSTETDGVHVIEATMDGRALPEGDEAGQVEIDRGRSRTRVVWHFAPTRDRVHTFSLRFRYIGVVRHGDGEDWFRWPPYPTRFDYPIEAGTVRLTWPASARPRRLPEVTGPAASTSPIENGIALQVANYRERQSDVGLTVRFEAGAFPGAEPQWQRDERRAERMAPAFIAGACMIAAAAALALWLFFLRYRRDIDEAPLPDGAVISPPDGLPPALAGSISRGRVGISGPQLLAATFDLARRGVLTIEEREATGLFKQRRFVVRRGADAPLRPHEQRVLDVLFGRAEQWARFDKSLQRVAGKAGRIRKSIESELAEAGLLDADRKDGASGLMIGGGVVVAFALVLALVVAALGMRLGGASMLIPAAFGLSGVVLMITGGTFSTLSPAGVRAARRWDAYRRHLKHQIKAGTVVSDGRETGRVLPYAAALGLLSAFGRALKNTEVQILPTWLRSLDTVDGRAAMVALIASGSSSVSHGSSGGSSAGGAGAGGSSSAS